MTNEEKLDMLLLARSALKTAVIFTEQALGTDAAFQIVKEPAINAVALLSERISEMRRGR